VKALVLLLSLLGVVTCASSASAQQITDPAYARPGRMVAVEPGRRLNLYCQGHGAPTVIFDAGLAEEASTWGLVQPAVARRTRACAYDRAGIGFSDPARRPGSSGAIADDLWRLTQAAHLTPPFVLVGHSYGGLNVKLFAARHPRATAGLVLVDPSQENEMSEKAIVQPDWQTAFVDPQLADYRTCVAKARRGMSHAEFDGCNVEGNPIYSAAINRAHLARRSQPGFQAALLSEDEQLGRGWSGEEMRAAARSFGAMPLIVLTAPPHSGPLAPGISQALRDAMNRGYNRWNDESAALSTRGARRRIANSGHYIHWDQPEVVIAAINEVLDQATRPAPTPH
jgi:pimeloyl-ACP methyl ester carboxylesterase